MIDIYIYVYIENKSNTNDKTNNMLDLGQKLGSLME